MTRFKQLMARVLGCLCMLVFTSLVLNVLWGVVTRYLLGHQAHWTEELARLLLVWLAMIGAALAYIENKHLGVDVLTRSLHSSSQRVARFLTHLVVFLFASAVMIYGGVSLVIDRWQAGQVLAALSINKAWFYLAVPISGLLIAVFALDATLAAMTGRATPTDPQPVEVKP